MSKDVNKTKGRILIEATELFCNNNYSKVTIKEISLNAKCNIAAINYHFQNKVELYCATIEQSYLETIDSFRQETVNLSDLEKLEALLDLRLDSALFPLAQHSFSRLINQEMQNPSPVHDLIATQYLKPMFERLKAIIKDYLGPKATDIQVQTASFMVRSICIGMHITAMQDEAFWLPHSQVSVKNESKQFTINSIINYKKQIEGTH